MSSSLGASADDAATDDILHEGEARAGRSEWEDALIKHNIIEAQRQEATEDDRHLTRAEQRQSGLGGREQQLADAPLDELDELEDEVDDRVLQHYRSAPASRHRPTHTELHSTPVPSPNLPSALIPTLLIPSSHLIPSHSP